MMEQILPGLAALQNIHPLFVHFPIAFFWGALAMEGAAILVHERFHFAATWMLYLGALSALVTAATGFHAMNQIAAASGGHDSAGHEFIHVHQRWMISVTAMAVLLAAYLFWINKRNNWSGQRWGFVVGLLLLSVAVALGADRGARLVYEFGTGVNPALIKEMPQETDQDHHH